MLEIKKNVSFLYFVNCLLIKCFSKLMSRIQFNLLILASRLAKITFVLKVSIKKKCFFVVHEE
jgi:hypothetical protein